MKHKDKQSKAHKIKRKETHKLSRATTAWWVSDSSAFSEGTFSSVGLPCQCDGFCFILLYFV